MVSLAVNDPGFSVEKDYYQKSMQWDQTQAQMGVNHQLGWHTSSSLVLSGRSGKLTLQLGDAQGKALAGAQVKCEAFAVARGTHPMQVELAEKSPGLYVGSLEQGRPGLWELRFTVRLGSDLFTNVTKLDAELLDPTLGAAPVGG